MSSQPRPQWSRSQTEKVLQDIVGIHARVWVRKEGVELGVEQGGRRIVIGRGEDCFDAFDKTFLQPLKHIEENGGMDAWKERIRAAKAGEEPQPVPPPVDEPPAS